MAVIELDYMEYANDGAAQAAYVTDADPQVVFSQALSLTGAGWFDYSFRTLIPNGDISADASTIRIVIKGGATEGTKIKLGYVGYPAGAGDAWDFDGNQVQIKWSATTGCTVGAGATLTSDPITFSLDKTKDLLVALDVDSDTEYDSVARELGLNGGHNSWYHNTPGDTEAGDTAPDAYTLAAGTCYIVTQVLGDPNLQCYSEDIIIQQGTYSLKVVAAITDSLNDTLTKSGLSIDLTDKDTLKLWAYASRTGTNLQVQIHDSGAYTSDFCTGGTATDSDHHSAAVAALAFDDNEITQYESDQSPVEPFPHWIKYDLGGAVTKTARKLRMKALVSYAPNNFTLAGSNNDSDWDNIHSDNHSNNSDWQEYTFANSTAYRYYRLTFTDGYDANIVVIKEVEIMEYSYHTKDIVISSATTWTEITWDISGIANADKDDIDSIIIKIINADVANTFYVDNFYAPEVIVGNSIFFGANF